MNARISGVRDALETYGLEKTAWNVNWSGLAQGAKSMAIGDPGRVLKELRAGTLHTPGGALHEAVMPRKWYWKALNWGLPAVGAISALGAPEEQRGSAVGDALGRGIGSMLGSPLGMVGMMAGGALGGSLGRTVGSTFNAKPHRERPYYFNDPSFVS